MPTPEIKYQSDNILKLTKKSLCANVHILVGVFHTDQAYLIFLVLLLIKNTYICTVSSVPKMVRLAYHDCFH